jgi:hypothetical protein
MFTILTDRSRGTCARSSKICSIEPELNPVWPRSGPLNKEFDLLHIEWNKTTATVLPQTPIPATNPISDFD